MLNVVVFDKSRETWWCVTNRVKRGARGELRGWCIWGKRNVWGKEQWQQDKELEPMLLQKQQHKQQQQCR